MDELLQKGWGLGSGISLFILAGVAQAIFWDAFSPVPAGTTLRGSIFAYFQDIFHGNSPLTSFYSRPSSLPTMLGLAITIAILLVVIYLDPIRAASTRVGAVPPASRRSCARIGSTTSKAGPLIP